MSKIKTDDINVTSESEESKTENLDMHELVKIKLFKDNDKYSEDVFVSVNGNNFLIQRGVEVEVPRYVEEVIRNAEEQRKNAEFYCEKGWENSKIKDLR